MEASSGQNHDNKIALQVNFNPTAANIMDLLHIFVINKQYLFQRVSNFFFATWVIFVLIIGILFSFMPWIIFQWGVDKTRNTEHSETFRNIPEHPGTFSGLAVKVDWFLGRPFWTLLSGGLLSKRMPRRNNVRERNKRGFHLSYKICQEPVVFALVMRFSGPNI